jgi:uncharacterized membrane protein YraQ (UPF0718 family)
VVFLTLYFIPVGNARFQNAVIEALAMVQDYAREHMFLSLVPAFFIAGAIAQFINQGVVTRYFGAKAKKILSYSVASVSGTLLAVCSCTVLPLFAGIYRRGAGLGPATTFLYSGPAINVLAIVLTARVLGFEFGIARVVGAIIFSIVIGLLMHFIFYAEEKKRMSNGDIFTTREPQGRPLWKTLLYFASIIGILIFANWSKNESIPIWHFIYKAKWFITGFLLMGLTAMLIVWFKRNELRGWLNSTWGFTKQILPLLFAGILIAGFLLGRPGHASLIPREWIEGVVGGNSISANLFAALSGALMYFCTLVEVPILQGLLSAGMGKGPALALLLAGPALSLPNMLVLRTIIGTRKAAVYVCLVIVMATFSGMLYGHLFR